jgi:hypothetical protein
MLSKGLKISALSFRAITRFGLCLVGGSPKRSFDRGAGGGLTEGPFCPLQ